MNEQKDKLNDMENDVHVGEEVGTNESNIADKAHDLYSATKTMKEQLIAMRNEMKDQKALRRSDYDEKRKKYNKIFTIKNKKTNKVVELVAPTVTAAANFIGWRLRHTILVEEKEIENKEKTE